MLLEPHLPACLVENHFLSQITKFVTCIACLVFEVYSNFVVTYRQTDRQTDTSYPPPTRARVITCRKITITITTHIRDLAKATKGGWAPSYVWNLPPYIVVTTLFYCSTPFLLLVLGLKCFRILAKGHGLLKKPRNLIKVRMPTPFKYLLTKTLYHIKTGLVVTILESPY